MNSSHHQHSEKNPPISVDVQNYTHVDQLPLEIKQKLQQSFGHLNGKDWISLLTHGTHVKNKPMFSINVNGQNYNNIDQLPEEAKQKMKNAFDLLEDGNKDGVPDMLQGGVINFFKGLSPLHSGSLLKNQAEQLINNKTNSPIESMTAKEDRAEKFRVVLVVLVVLGMAVALGWEWIMEKLTALI